MLLTITTTHQPATDLGFLLHKNPARSLTAPMAFGSAHVFYPEATVDRCTAALLLDIDPIGLVRRKGRAQALEHYVNDRPYVASSYLSVALAHFYREAMAGKSKERAELALAALPLEACLDVVPSRGGPDLLRRLFEPLGYSVEARGYPLDETFPAWGASPYYSLKLTATMRLADLLTHLYVLIPVLDDDKHYYVGDDEVEKLLHRGEGWLNTHPERELIVSRYLRRLGKLTREAVERLTREEDPAAEDTAIARAAEEEAIEKPISLHAQRLEAVVVELKASGANRVLDLGCGEGRLIQLLMKEPQFTEIVGMDVSYRSLETARDRVHFERLPPRQQQRLTFLQGALTYRDARLAGFDAAAVVEVIEHLDPGRLAAFERVLFEAARPAQIVITTPNAEYNVKFASLPAGKFRHRDHRFEWTRAEFEAWANGVAGRHGYNVRYAPIGPLDEALGAPSQMAVFVLEESEGVATT